MYSEEQDGLNEIFYRVPDPPPDEEDDEKDDDEEDDEGGDETPRKTV